MNYPDYSIGGVLVHHGIQGQKWGKRNGPPYPLKPSDHSQAEKKAAKKQGSVPALATSLATKAMAIKIGKAAIKTVLSSPSVKIALTSAAALTAIKVGKDIYVHTKLKKLEKRVSELESERNPENFDPFKAMDKIDKSLSRKEKDFLGVGNDGPTTDDVKFFFNKDQTAYLITADYHGEFKDEHPYSGKIIGIAAEKKARGTGDTDKLISQAKEEFKNDRLVAEIDDNNIPSKKLFERNGFKNVETIDGISYYIWEKEKSKH